MAGGIAGLLRQRAPAEVGDDDDDTVNDAFVGMLKDPARRPSTLAYLRQHVPEYKEAPDDELADHIITVSARSKPTLQSPQERQQIREGNAYEGGAKAREQLYERGAENAASQGMAGQPANAYAAGQSQQQLDDTPGFGFGIPGQGTAQKYPEVRNMQQVRRMMAKDPSLRFVVPTAGVQGMLVRGSEPVALLDTNASVAGVEGVNPIQRATGQDSAIQQGMVSAARLLWDPSKGSEDGEAPMGLDTGYGFRELGADAGAKQGRAVPNAELAGASVLGHAVKGGAALAANIDEAEAAAFAKLHDITGADAMRYLAQQNEEEAKGYREVQRLTGDTLGDLSDARAGKLPEAQKLMMAEEAGRSRGEAMGDVVSMVAPTEASLVAPALGAANKATGGVAGKTLGKAAAWTGKQVVDAAPTLSRFVSDVASKAALSGAPRLAVSSAEAAGNNAEQIAARNLDASIREPMMGALEKMGVTDAAAQKKVLREALDAWPTEAGRRAASPQAQELIRVAQPIHQGIFDRAKAAGQLGDLEYNPLHLYIGQDPTKAARMNETAAARLAVESGVDPWKATPVPPTMPGGTHAPGLDAYMENGAWKAGVRPADTRSLEEVMGNITKRTDVGGIGAVSRAERDDILKDLEGRDILSGLVVSAQKAADTDPARRIASAGQFRAMLPTLEQEAVASNPKTTLWKPAAEIFPNLGTGPGRTATGELRKGGRTSFSPEVMRALEAEDGVIAYAGRKGVKDRLDDIYKGQRVVDLPAEYADLDGKVIPRHVALAIEQMSLPQGEKYSVQMRRVTQAFDRMLGRGQIKENITQGNPGFGIRNYVGNLFRIAAHDPDALLDPRNPARNKLVDLVGAVSHAPLDPAAGTAHKLGKETYTTGQLHEMMVSLLGVGRGAQQKMLGMEPGSQGVGTLAEAVLSGGGRAPNVADAANRVARAVPFVGKKVNDAADRIARHGWNLNENYTADEGLKMLSFLGGLRRGMTPQAAARDTQALLIDYSSTSGAKELAGAAVPFIKYYTGAFQAAAKLAVQHPRRYSRVYDVMRNIENADAQLQGGGRWDPRGKNIQDRIMGNPQMAWDNEPVTARVETPVAELQNLVAMGTGQDARGLTGLLAPDLSRAYGFATGKDLATGRSVLGLSPDEMAQSSPLLGMPGQYAQAWRNQEATGANTVGAHPVANALYQLAKYAPLLGGAYVPTWADPLARTGLDVGASPASRSTDQGANTLRRLAASGITGTRFTAQNRPMSFQQAQTQALKASPKPSFRTNEMRAKGGR